MAGLSGKSNCRVDSHIDVSEDDGLIIIADKIPDNWQGAPDIHSYQSLDRNFVFAGEQVQLLICLSANEHNSGIITSSENVIGQRPPRQNRKVEETISVSQAECANTGEQNNQNGEARGKMDSQQDASTGKYFVRSDDQRILQTGQFLQRFKNSHFFARISESDEPLWSERSAQEACFKLMEASKERLSGDSAETAQILKNNNPTSVVIDRGQLHSPTSGGIARGAAKCFSLSNGDIVNVSPAFAPDVVVFLDSITMVFEEASSNGPPLSLPVTCIEAGNDYSLPNLALRKGEEHSFILKPVTMLWRHSKGQNDSNVGQPRRSTRTAISSRHSSSNMEWRHSDPPAVQYAVLVSCRCNYTESKLFYRHPVNWQPRIAGDLMLSVASEISRQTLASHGTQLPFQAITLHASNMTSDDLTLTVLAPTPLTTNPSLVSDMIPNIHLSCTHLCLRSRVPLGCVPSKSTVAINLELLPLTDGIICLDSLQIAVKEKGRTYTPKHTLKIAAASRTASVIM